MPAVTLITAVPNHVSPEEHRTIVGATPSSFSDIPPVLRHKEENVKVALEPPVEGFGEADAASGTLYVIESALTFMSSTGKGFQVLYPSITLHAVSRAEAGPSIYCQLDESVDQPNGSGEDDDDFAMRELSIIPQNANSLEPIFEALSLCASLHPDPNADDDDDMGDDNAFIDPDVNGFEPFTGTEEQELSEVGRAALDYLESIIVNPYEKQVEIGEGEDGQFADAEEPEATKSTADDKPAASS
ncbi:hypothetical protein PUNSTDRAFT_47229 [Punctularia strigosozonata HHB-11173 SS5]|uniref:Regulator of volume decrease after cellular swelling-domain-containing protein n=1 Tax=Punctularia strigosozonata (strain HHB-11173) TaxID=741275 RepID=R7S3L2_PUNST|nr:uncharacterized protein PUNSTDRAFT_47229 [Punctularia strigosozonata HHB-11173 SS5]EIN04995.1 hypothetical protein PUNSTDRAFT_47229 [Punctularia strigosozonata HHB-11173 SS5]